MHLKEATDRAAAALEGGNMEALTRALESRRKALESGEPPTIGVFDSGQRLLRTLLAFQQRAAYDSARLGQIRRYLEFRK
jgi:hypothetical protein